jgi:oligosaccharyltransferase complex subunit beta
MRALASEFDIEVETESVFDHKSFDKEDHSLIATSEIVAPEAIIDHKALEAPVLYSGTGLNIGRLPLSTAILNAGSDAFVAESYNKRANSGETVSLVGALQSRNSARVTFVGSLDIFSDKLVSSSVNIGSGKT